MVRNARARVGRLRQAELLCNCQFCCSLVPATLHRHFRCVHVGPSSRRPSHPNRKRMDLRRFPPEVLTRDVCLFHVVQHLAFGRRTDHLHTYLSSVGSAVRFPARRSIQDVQVVRDRPQLLPASSSAGLPVVPPKYYHESQSRSIRLHRQAGPALRRGLSCRQNTHPA